MLDSAYFDLQQIIMDELNRLHKWLTGLKKSRKALRHKPKEWWCNELERKWKLLKDCAKMYRKCPKMSLGAGEIRSQFNEAQKSFDKLVKKLKREHYRKKVQEIERANTADPMAFWNFIQKLNPRKSKQIPMEVFIGETH